MFEKLYVKRFNILFLVLISTYLNILWIKDLDLVLANSSHLLPYINLFNNPLLFYNDLARIYLPKTASFYYILPALLGKFIDAHVITYGVYILSNTLLVFAIFYLAYHLFKNLITGFISIFLLMGINLSVFAPGNSQPFGCNTFPAMFAIPVLIIAILFFIKDKYYIAFTLTGLMFNFHGSHAIFVLFMFTFYFLLNYRTIGFKKIFKSFGFFVLFASPLLVWMLLSNPESNSTVLPTSEWIKLVRIRTSGHVFPFSWNFRGVWWPFLAILSMYLIALRYAPKADKHSIIRVFSIAIFLLCLIGTVFVELIPVPLVMKATLFRSTLLLIVFAAIYISHILIVEPLESEGGVLRKFAGMGILVALSLSVSKYYIFRLLFLPFLGIQSSLLVEGENEKLPKYLRNLSIGLLLVLFLLSGAPHLGLKQVDNSVVYVGLRTLGLVLLIFVIFYVSDFLRKKLPFKINSGTVVFVIALALTIFNFHTFVRGETEESFLKDWKNVQLWSRQNTSSKEVFITPPYISGFRVFSERSIVGTWFDVGYGIYVPEVQEEALKRMKSFGVNPFDHNSHDEVHRGLKQKYNFFSEEDFKKLGNEYHASYIVVEKPKGLDFKRAYENDHFAVYALPSRGIK